MSASVYPAVTLEHRVAQVVKLNDKRNQEARTKRHYGYMLGFYHDMMQLCS